jgi:hypothetical protein
LRDAFPDLHTATMFWDAPSAYQANATLAAAAALEWVIAGTSTSDDAGNRVPWRRVIRHVRRGAGD